MQDESYESILKKKKQAELDKESYEQKTLKKNLEWSEELRSVYKGMIANQQVQIAKLKQNLEKSHGFDAQSNNLLISE